MLGKFFAISPWGGVLKVFLGVVAAGFVTFLNKGGSTATVSWHDLIVWVDAALIVAVPMLINVFNTADARYGVKK